VSTTLVAIDRPAAGATTPQRFTIIGWAADPAGVGSGVDAVQVYLDGPQGQGVLLGTANYGEDRPDVATQLGQPRFGLSGFSVQIEVPAGAHSVYVHARRHEENGSGAWSPPAQVDVVATAAVTVAEGARSAQQPSTGCPRAPDGSCINRAGMAAPTCQQIGPSGQCLSAPPGSQAPGWVGVPSSASTPVVSGAGCLQYDAGGRCVTTLPSGNSGSASLVLRQDNTAGSTMLSWSAMPGASSYEVLRCSSSSGQSCNSVTIMNTTSYPIGQSGNAWYVIHARNGAGQTIATSNVLGPP
jgi:hypothetical protein